MSRQNTQDAAGGLDAAEAEWLADARELEQIRAVAEILRGILRTAAAGALAGVVLAGFGGRIVMRIAAMINPQAAGALTEQGAAIGAITFNGTLALVIIGLVSGLAATVVWTAVAQWIPGKGVRRALIAGAIAVALAGMLVVQSSNTDFVILDADLLIIGMLIGLIAALGFSLALMDEWLDRRVPHPGANPRTFAIRALMLVLLGGVVLLPLTIATYFGERACACSVIPLPLGVPLTITGAATVTWWTQHVLGRTGTSAQVQRVGRVGLLASVGLGAAILAAEVWAIVD